MTKNELKESLYSSLIELGLTEQETDIYITSLALGPTTISRLAESLSMARPNVYKLIGELEKHGLAKFSEKKRFSHTFVVEPPTVLLDAIRKKRESVARLDHTLLSAMPDLMALYHQGASPTKVQVFTGPEQFDKTLDIVIEEATGEVQLFGSLDDMLNFMHDAGQQRFIKHRIKKGIPIRALFFPGEATEKLKATDKDELRETRVLVGVKPFATSFQIFSNKVIIWQPKTPLALLIEDEYIVEMLRNIFERLWEISGEKHE